MTGALKLLGQKLYFDSDLKMFGVGDKVFITDDGGSARDLGARLISMTELRLPATAPPSPVACSCYFDTINRRLYIYGGFPPSFKYVDVNL